MSIMKQKIFFKLYSLLLRVLHKDYLSLNIFNPYGYSIIYSKDLEETSLSSMEHYIKYGITNNYQIGNNPPRDLFFEKGYQFLYKDEIKNLQPWVHYCLYGFKHHYNNGNNPPNDLFDPVYYLDKYWDVLQSRMNPWEHYVIYGYNEGRSAKDPKAESDYDLIKNSHYFDAEYYKNSYPDLYVLDDIDLIKHYMIFGYKENRRTSPSFNAVEYVKILNLSPFVNPLLHYEKLGKFNINRSLIEMLIDY